MAIKLKRKFHWLSVDILIKVCNTALKSLLQTMNIYSLHTLFYRKFNLAARLIQQWKRCFQMIELQGWWAKILNREYKTLLLKIKLLVFSFRDSAYWKEFLHQVLAMIKQLGTPTFLLTLSCADLPWNELLSIIFNLNHVDISDEEAGEMSYHDRCGTLNKSPVLVAWHFQYKGEMFFNFFVLDRPLGKTHYYASRVEFQVSGNLHIHSFIWILNAPKLTNVNIDNYREWVDSVVRSDLPDPNKKEHCLNLQKLIKYVIIQKPAVNLEMKSVGSVLVTFSQKNDNCPTISRFCSSRC